MGRHEDAELIGTHQSWVFTGASPVIPVGPQPWGFLEHGGPKDFPPAFSWNFKWMCRVYSAKKKKKKGHVKLGELGSLCPRWTVTAGSWDAGLMDPRCWITQDFKKHLISLSLYGTSGCFFSVRRQIKEIELVCFKLDKFLLLLNKFGKFRKRITRIAHCHVDVVGQSPDLNVVSWLSV